MENKTLLGVAIITSLIGLSSLFALSVYLGPKDISSDPENYLEKYVVLKGVVSEAYEKFLVVNKIEIFSLEDVDIGDYIIVEGVLKKTPEKYIKRGFPEFQIYPEKFKVHKFNESFFACYVEENKIKTNFGSFVFNENFGVDGIGGIIGGKENEKLIINDIFSLKCDYLEGKTEKRGDETYINDIKIDINSGFGNYVEAYGILNKEFFCLYYENLGKRIEKICDLKLNKVYTIRGKVKSRRYYYDGYLIELEDQTGRIKAYIKGEAFEECIVEVSGVYKEFRSEEMLVGEAKVISDEICVYDLDDKIPEGKFWGAGVVKMVENIRGHLYLYIGNYKISVYSGEAKKFLEHGIDLYHCEGKKLTIFLENNEDIVLLDVKE